MIHHGRVAARTSAAREYCDTAAAASWGSGVGLLRQGRGALS
ncbi:hypothetical protein [Streptomyces phaeoluteigriseus]